MSESNFVSDELGQLIVKQISMSERAKSAAKDNNNFAKIEKYKILNFEGVNQLSFTKFKKEFSFKWGSINKLFNDISIEEASYRSSFTWEYLEYFYEKKFNKEPFVFTIKKHRYNRKFITDLFTYLDPPTYSFRLKSEYGDTDNKLTSFVLLVEDDLIINFDSDNDIVFYIDPDKHLLSNDDNPFYLLLRLFKNYKNDSVQNNKIHIVYKDDYGFDKLAFDVKKVHVDIDTHYNDDFKDISEQIINNLNDKNKTGLYILEGNVGTGKTMFIRMLTNKIKRNIIFISPDTVDYITDPSFIPFLMNNSDSVLIIEDAEPALQKRDGLGRTGAISNILNLTDGLLSDCLNISIVATFNTNTKNIDDALLRKGRLINSYHFDKLCAEKSKKLLQQLGYDIKDDIKPMSLAEIYFHGKDNKSTTYKNDKKIGFKN